MSQQNLKQGTRFGKWAGKRHPFPVLERYAADPETGCWVWRGAITHGYGACSWKGKSFRAHRVFYEHHRGPIPDGLQIDHLCRNKACVNPDHLEPVTHAENARRRPETKLTREVVNEIRKVTDALCEKHGISSGALAHIVRRTRWADEEE